MCNYRKKKTLSEELSRDEIQCLVTELKEIGVKHVCMTGAEPLCRNDIIEICDIFMQSKIELSLCTNGTLLVQYAKDICRFFKSIFISLDTCVSEKYKEIRGIDAFASVIKGVRQIKRISPEIPIRIRTVVMKQNYQDLVDIIRFAKNLKVDGISFIPVDVSSVAFGRNSTNGKLLVDKNVVLLSAEDIKRFCIILEQIKDQCKEEFTSGFLINRWEEFLQIKDYFLALQGKFDYPMPSCIVPWISLVIEADGSVRPCFFTERIANIREKRLKLIISSRELSEMRRRRQINDLKTCRLCVFPMECSSLESR